MRSAVGIESLVDLAAAFVRLAGEEQQVLSEFRRSERGRGMPHGQGDDAIVLLGVERKAAVDAGDLAVFSSCRDVLLEQRAGGLRIALQIMRPSDFADRSRMVGVMLEQL